MSGTKLLVDTNIVLYLLNGDNTIANLLNDKHIYISFITELELLAYSELTNEESAKIQSFIEECRIIDINEHIKAETIRIKREHHLKLPDCIIAATSKYLNIPIITADSDFKRIDDIDVVHYQDS